MMRRLLTSIVLACTLSNPISAQNTNADIFGKWRVATALDSADITALDDKAASKLVGKSVKISSRSFEFDGQVCKAPTYERSTEKSAIFFREQMRASTANLHIPDTITVIDARCTFLFPKPDGKMMFFWHGFFFDAERTAPQRQAPPK